MPVRELSREASSSERHLFAKHRLVAETVAQWCNGKPVAFKEGFIAHVKQLLALDSETGTCPHAKGSDEREDWKAGFAAATVGRVPLMRIAEIEKELAVELKEGPVAVPVIA